MPSTTAQMQSISGIITQVHSTTGEVPPPLVGASITVVDNHVYVFAGRLVTSRKMTNHLYVLNLDTLAWTRHIPPPDSAKPPKPRYFHSADVYNKSIVIFGGMGYSRVSTDGLCVLDDISVFDIESACWKRPTIEPSLFAPRPRYAHLSAVTDDQLLIIGGQDMNNNYLGEINVLDLRTWQWIHAKSFDKHVGAYRSVAVSGPPDTRLPTALNSGPSSPERINGYQPPSSSSAAGSSGDHLACNTTEGPKKDTPPVYLYTNYNFADVKRELQLIFSPTGASSVVEDCSSYMTGSAMPPGLRFPTGHTLGHHLVLAGTYLSPQTQAFSIWALDLGTLAWIRIETGSLFSNGSWNRGVLHGETSRYLVFGHRGRNLLEDYNNRQVNFDHLAVVDLEAFGVYDVPKSNCSTLAQEMGLGLLNEPAISDFNIQTLDNQVIPVNSAILCNRWPYFAKLMESNFKSIQVSKMVENPGTTNESTEDKMVTIKVPKSNIMSFPYPYSVTIALLQYLYTDNLLTAQQYQPHILSQLLLISDMYELNRLRALTRHALHQMLNMTTAPLIFETAALSHQTSLQVRALKMMIAAKRMYQQQQQETISPRDGTYSVYGESVSSFDGRRPSDFPSPTSSMGYYQTSPVPSTFSSYHRGYAGQPPPQIRRNNPPSPATARSAYSVYAPKPATDISPPPTPQHGVPLTSAASSVPTSPKLKSSSAKKKSSSSREKRPILQSVGAGVPMNFHHF